MFSYDFNSSYVHNMFDVKERFYTGMIVLPTIYASEG